MANPQISKTNGIKTVGSGHCVIKISKSRYDVLKPDKKPVRSPRKVTPAMLSLLALPFLEGARTQVTRYNEASLNPNYIERAKECLHETSTLFEDLNTVRSYLEECNRKNELHQLWLDVRNHIRHDIREELDDEDEKRKVSRARKLKIDEALQTDIEFLENSIRIGGAMINLDDIRNYLNWAEKVITSFLNRAMKEGHYRSENN
jgi:hypothetical protein